VFNRLNEGHACGMFSYTLSGVGSKALRKPELATVRRTMFDVWDRQTLIEVPCAMLAGLGSVGMCYRYVGLRRPPLHS